MFFITSISIAGITIALFTSVLIFSRDKKRPVDFLLMGWLLSTGFNLSFFLWSGRQVPFLINLLGISMPLVHGPLLFLFVKHAFSKTIAYHEAKHFVSWLVFMLVFGFWWFLNPHSLDFRFGFMVFTSKAPWLFYQYGFLFALVAGGYTLAAFFQIRKHKKQLERTHSSEVRNIFNWLQRWIINAIFFFVATYLVVEITVSTGKINMHDTFRIISFFISIYIFYISFYGIKHTQAFQKLDAEVLACEKELTEGTNEEKVKEIIKRLYEVMEDEQPYLDPDLTIADLSKLCGLPSGQISAAINKGLDKNFYDFINEYRVKEFIQRIDEKEYAQLSLLGLAYDCGFRSKSTFNAFFKRYTGRTPSHFKKNPSNASG